MHHYAYGKIGFAAATTSKQQGESYCVARDRARPAGRTATASSEHPPVARTRASSAHEARPTFPSGRALDPAHEADYDCDGERGARAA